MDWPSDSNEDFGRTGLQEGLQYSQKDSIVTDVSSRPGGLQTDFDDISFAGEEDAYEADVEAQNIKVCVRLRPILGDEREDSIAWTWDQNTIYPKQEFCRKGSGQSNHVHFVPFTYDNLFYPEHTNIDIFQGVVKNIALQCMLGYHGSVFTYGQTSSGKTFTMNGSSSQPGIIPQAIYYCFETIQDHFVDREFLFRVSYIEVYNEQVKDLLSNEPSSSSTNTQPIKLQFDPRCGSTVLTGVIEQVVFNPSQVLALLKAGEAQRHVGTTSMNDKSSRAHTIFKLTVESRIRAEGDDSPIRISTFNLVDLAGSENAKMTNIQGERAREAKHINQSLLTLSLIIHRLSEGGRQHLPFRDSKLTRLLQPSLSGNANVAVICTVSLPNRCIEETNNTLRFATRAKRIKMHARVNEIIDDKALLRAYKKEIDALRARLEAVGAMGGVGLNFLRRSRPQGMLFSSEQNPFDLIAPDINASPTGVEGYHNSSSSLNNSSHNPLDAGTGPRTVDAEDVFDRWLEGIDTIDHDSWKNKNDEKNETNHHVRGHGVVNGELVLQMILEMEHMIFRANVLSSASSSASLSSSSNNNHNHNHNMSSSSSSAITHAASERTVTLSVDAAIARVVAHMNRSTIPNGNNSQSNKYDSRDMTDSVTTISPTIPITSEHSPLHSQDTQGQGLVSQNGLTSDEEVISGDMDPNKAIHGNNSEMKDGYPVETSVENRRLSEGNPKLQHRDSIAMMINLPSFVDEINHNHHCNDNNSHHNHILHTLNGNSTLPDGGVNLLVPGLGMLQLPGASDSIIEKGTMIDGENTTIIDTISPTNGSSSSSSTPSVVGADAQEELQMMASIIESELQTKANSSSNNSSNNNSNNSNNSNNNNGAISITKQANTGTSVLPAGGNGSMGKPSNASIASSNGGSGTGIRTRKQSFPISSSSSSSSLTPSQTTRVQRSSSYNAPTPNNHLNNNSSSNTNHRPSSGGGGGGDREKGSGSDKYTLPLLIGDDGEYLIRGSQQGQGLGLDSPLQNHSTHNSYPLLNNQKSNATHIRMHQSLLGVSRMLAVLKHHVERTIARSHRGSGLNQGIGQGTGLGSDPRVFSFVRGTAANAVAVERNRVMPRSTTTPSSSGVDEDAAASASVRRMMLLISEGDEDQDHSPLSRSPQRQGLDPTTDDLHHGDGSDEMGDPEGVEGGVAGVSGSESSSLWMKERIQWERKMKLLTVDNRFLQEEVEKKDGMLGLLTRGLKEVETSQQQWLQEIDTLSKNLDATAGQNMALMDEVARLRLALEAREKQLFDVTGVLPDCEEF